MCTLCKRRCFLSLILHLCVRERVGDCIYVDRKNPPPLRGFPICQVPSSRTVCKRNPLEEPGTNLSRGVLLHTVRDQGTWQIENPPGRGGFFRSMCMCVCLCAQCVSTGFVLVCYSICVSERERVIVYVYVCASVCTLCMRRCCSGLLLPPCVRETVCACAHVFVCVFLCEDLDADTDTNTHTHTHSTITQINALSL